MNYFDSSPDPFHAVQTSVDMLIEAGFQELEDVMPYTGQLVPGENDIQLQIYWSLFFSHQHW